MNFSRTPRKVSKPGGAPARRRAGAREKNSNLKTAVFLFLIPVGFALMWRRSCTWPRWVKLSVSAIMVAVLAAIFLFPVPDTTRVAGGVEMVTDRREVEVYGPELPTLIVPGYTRDQTGSIIVPAVENDVHYVYAAEGAKCYHEYRCKFAYASSQRLTVYEAHYLGYTPCGRCNPPPYTGD